MLCVVLQMPGISRFLSLFLSLSLPLTFLNKENFAHVLIQKVEVKVFIENDNFIHVFNVSNERKN